MTDNEIIEALECAKGGRYLAWSVYIKLLFPFRSVD